MNVKTGCAGYPKSEMLQVVGEIKGETAAKRAARRERRGKSIAFTKDFTVGGRKVTLTAGGNNKKFRHC